MIASSLLCVVARIVDRRGFRRRISVAVLALVAHCSLVPGALAETATHFVDLGTPSVALAVNTATNKIYAVTPDTDEVVVINGATYEGTAVGVGDAPAAVAVNSVTNRIYVANEASDNVTVINGDDNTVIATVPVGTGPVAVALSQVMTRAATNKIYVANQGSGNVTVIDGVTHATSTIGVGTAPAALTINPATNQIYAANRDSDNVTVIDGATHFATTITDPNADQPVALAVNPATNLVYVANAGSSNVTVIDGLTHDTTTIEHGSPPVAVAVNPVTNRIYVANSSGTNITVIDGATNATTAVSSDVNAPLAIAANPLTDTYYLAGTGFGVLDGATNTGRLGLLLGFNRAIAVNPVTDRIYAAEGNFIRIYNGIVGYPDPITDIPTAVGIGLEDPFPVTFQAVNPVTNKVYATDLDNVLVIDGETDTIVKTVDTPGQPNGVAVNPVTNKVYVTDRLGGPLLVIDAETDTLLPGIDLGGTFRYLPVVNPVTNKVYVLNDLTADVAVVDGATDSHITSIDLPGRAFEIGVNPATNKIYVTRPEQDGIGGLSVIDGDTDTAIESLENFNAFALGVNPVTNRVYFSAGRPSFEEMDRVVVVDGATDSVVSTVPLLEGSSPFDLDVNPVSNKVYVLGHSDCGCIAIIDGATDTLLKTVFMPELSGLLAKPRDLAINPASNTIYAVYWAGLNFHAYVLDGVSDAEIQAGVIDLNFRFSLQGVPSDVAVNPVTGKAYAATQDHDLTVLTEQPTQPSPLQAGIEPLPGDVTHTPTPTFDFLATTNFTPSAPQPDSVLFQVDTWQGPWTAATAQGIGAFSGQVAAPLQPGFHILYAYATDGQHGTSTLASAAEGTTTGPLIGNIAAYPFLVSPTACGEPNHLKLESEIVTSVEELIACFTITAANGFGVGASGDLTLLAGESVVFHEGFSVAAGGSLGVIMDSTLAVP